MLTFKDIARLFEEMERRLVSSLKRNLRRHKNEEETEGFNWAAWQAEKLKSLEKFRRENRQIMNEYADVIDSGTRKLMAEQFDEGKRLASSEPGVRSSVSDEHFFGVNSDKMEHLISDITTLEKKAETAALRMMDDVYRQTLNRVQLEMAAGAMTLERAVDMAVKDFLAQGINCIVYRDGKRVNIADYARMALRTTSTRATLQGKAARYAEMGYDTVLVSQYGMCSQTCLPWQGRVYIDDVFTEWDGERDGDYGISKYCGKGFPLLSSAIRGGLFHPNCRHTITLWIEGRSKLPEPLDPKEIRERAKAEQRQRALEREVRRRKREVLGLSEPNAVKEAKQRLKEAQKKLKAHVDSYDYLRRDYNREKVYDVPKQPPVMPAESPKATAGETAPPKAEMAQSAAEVVIPQAEPKHPDGSKTYTDVPIRDMAAEQQEKQAEVLPKSSGGEENLYKGVDKSVESGIIKADVKKAEIPQEIDDDVNKAVVKVKEDFPIISEQVEPIEFADTGDALGENGLRGNKAINVIKLSARYCSNYSRLIAKLLDDFKRGFSYDTDNVGSLACHELGHAIHKILALKRAGIKYGEQLTPIKKIIFEKELYKITLEIYEAAFTDESYDEIQQICADELGTMATSPSELIAQSFGNYYFGKSKSRVAKAIIEYFKKELKI